MQIPWRRAGLASSVAGRLAVMSVAAGLLVAAVLVPVTGLVGVATRDAAKTFNDLNVAALGRVPTRSEIVDSKGKLIAYFYPDHKYRVPVKFGQIAPVMREAIIAIEDSRFYLHGALDPRGTIRALLNDSENKSVQGGSDLAQQYVKNALELTAPSNKAARADAALTPQRKIRELRVASNVEHEMTPNQLLAAYLNVAYFENQTYGIQVAAERYFSTSARHLTLREAAMLAGMVENPSLYDPLTHYGYRNARVRRNTVLQRMAQLHFITPAKSAATQHMRLGLKPSTIPIQTGCFSKSAQHEAFFCDYVLAVLRTDKAYRKVWSAMNTTGGLKIYTTLNAQDESAATHAVDYVMPPGGGEFNPNHNVDTEVLLQPGTGRVRAIAENRRYGSRGWGNTVVDYGVDEKYDGGQGVQTGSSSKVFTLVTALKQGIPFGFQQKVVAPANLGPYYSCKGQPALWNGLNDAEGPGKGTFTLYNGTTQSINVFFGMLEQKVGLCATVKTAASMGLHNADGKSLFQKAELPDPADAIPSFTLGSGAEVSPMSMADAYATVASRGIYCKPTAITKITAPGGKRFPVESADCHRVLSQAVADAANHILQGVLQPPGTASSAAGGEPSRYIGRPSAAKTGTANSGYYAAFAGYTPTLVGYVSVFNPFNPTNPKGEMTSAYDHSCYREVGDSLQCPSQMYGDMAPGATWYLTFTHADLGPPLPFAAVPPDSIYYRLGNGVSSPKPPAPPKHGKAPGGGGKGGGGGGPHH